MNFWQTQYNKDKWGFVDRSRVRGQWMENTRGNIKEKGDSGKTKFVGLLTARSE